MSDQLDGSFFPVDVETYNDCHVVVIFNNDYSRLVVDGGSYKLYNGDNVSPNIFDELHEILKVLPLRSELPIGEDGLYKITWRYVRKNELL